MGSTGTSCGCTGRSSPVSARRPGPRRASSASASTRGPSTTACSTSGARCSAIRTTTATSAQRRPCRRSTPWSRRPSSTRGPASSSCRSTRSTSWRPIAARPGSLPPATMLLIPDLIGFWLTRRPRGRGHERLDHRSARRPSPAVGRRRSSRTLGHPAGHLSAELGSPGDVVGPLRDDVLTETGTLPETHAHAGRLARHGVGGRRRPGRRPIVRLHRLRDVVAGRRRARAARS